MTFRTVVQYVILVSWYCRVSVADSCQNIMQAWSANESFFEVLLLAAGPCRIEKAETDEKPNSLIVFTFSLIVKGFTRFQ